MLVRLMVAVSLLAVGCKKAEPEPVARPAPTPRHAPARGPMISPVNFDSGSTEIKDSEEPAIDEAVGIMKSSDWTLLVVGLADATGDAVTNRELSLKRAEEVAARVREKGGLPESRIRVHAFGERLATGGAEASERKVEFIFFHDEGQPLREVVLRSRVLEEDIRAKR